MDFGAATLLTLHFRTGTSYNVLSGRFSIFHWPFSIFALLIQLFSNYEYWDPDDCDGDENCSVPADQRTNSAWAMAFLRRFYWAIGVSI